MEPARGEADRNTSREFYRYHYHYEFPPPHPGNRVAARNVTWKSLEGAVRGMAAVDRVEVAGMIAGANRNAARSVRERG